MNYEKLRCSKIEALVIFVTVNEMFLETTRKIYLLVFPNLDTQLISGFQCFSTGLTQLFLIKSKSLHRLLIWIKLEYIANFLHRPFLCC